MGLVGVAASGVAEPAGSDRDDPTREQDLHALDTARLPAARRYEEEPSDADVTQVDTLALSSPTSVLDKVIVESSLGHATSSAPAAASSSTPDPTTATRLAPGIRNLVPGTLVGEFLIERLLGAGGMGQVYGGRHEQLGRRVAVKVIAPSLSADRDAIERFAQEAVALARMSHPNIVGVLSVGSLAGDGRSYYVMEWLDGESLQARLHRGRLELDDALDVLDQVARGLEAAHASGIVHRDLKPDNVWLQRVAGEARPVVKILDFGLAKLAQHRRSEDTATGMWLGTPHFLSPEQSQSARDVGPATDVYALGCMAYELICGRLPFTYDNAAELIAAHRTEAPPWPRDLDPAVDRELDELIFAMLAKAPTGRPTLAAFRSTVAAVRMRRAGFSRAPRAATPTIIVRTSPATTSRSRRWIAVTIAVALMLGVVLISMATTRGGGADPSTARTVPPVGSAPPPVLMDVPVITTVPPVDAIPVEPRASEEPRKTAPSVRSVPHDRASDAAAPIAVDAGEPDEEPRELVTPKEPEPPPPRPTAPPVPKPPSPDRNQTFNPFTKRPVSR